MFNPYPNTIIVKEDTKYKLAKSVMKKYERGWECVKGIKCVTFESSYKDIRGKTHHQGEEKYIAVMRRRAI